MKLNIAHAGATISATQPLTSLLLTSQHLNDDRTIQCTKQLHNVSVIHACCFVTSNRHDAVSNLSQ